MVLDGPLLASNGAEQSLALKLLDYNGFLGIVRHCVIFRMKPHGYGGNVSIVDPQGEAFFEAI
jgi:hypothetical protein